MTTGRLLARNSALNLAGQALPVLVALVAIPPLVRGLGAERFAVLTLAWAAIGYFGLFEFGLARGLTQAVADRLGRGETKELPLLAWTALILLFALGMLGGILLAAVTPLLAIRLLNVPVELRDETIRAFWILSASLPLVLASVGMRGLMEAHQHFGVATALRAPLSASMFLGPLLVLPFSRGLVPAVLVLVAARVIGFLAHLWFCLRAYAYLRTRVVYAHAPVMGLLRFGGWTTVSNIVSPIMGFMDRFFVGALLPLAAVAHYVTPYEVVMKLLIIPLAFIGVMLPAFASTWRSSPERMTLLYERSLRVGALVMFPLTLAAVALAREGLDLWVGSALPAESTLVLQWLAVGVFVNTIAQTPLVALQGADRPDVIAWLHVFELPLYCGIVILATRAFGLPGVALAWTIRAAVDAIALLCLVRWKLAIPALPRLGGPVMLLAMLVPLLLAMRVESLVGRVGLVITVAAAFIPFAWRRLLTEAERSGLRDWLRRPHAVSAPAPSPERAT